MPVKVVKTNGNGNGHSDSTSVALMVNAFSGEEIVAWDKRKIIESLKEEGHHRLGEAKIQAIADEVEELISESGFDRITTNQIREMINSILVREGYSGTLAKYNILGIPTHNLDSILTGANKENSNTPYSPESINLTIAETVLKQYALQHIFTPDVAEAHLKGEIHVHDLGLAPRPYCGGHSLEYVKKYGLSLPNITSTSKPAKHAEVLVGHMVKMASVLQANYAGAVGWEAVNVFFAPLLRGRTYEEIKQVAQMLIFEFNQLAGARGGQAVFTDFNIYYGIPERFVDTPAIVASGRYIAVKDDGLSGMILLDESDEDLPDGYRLLTYKDFEWESNLFARALFEIYEEGDSRGSTFIFPKPLVHINTEAMESPGWDSFFDLICEVASKQGITYFLFDRDGASVAQCCLGGDTKVFVKHNSIVKYINFSALKDYKDLEDLYTWSPDGWAKVKELIVLPSPEYMIKVTLSNGSSIIVTEDHLQPILDGDEYTIINASDLSVGDWLPVTDKDLMESEGSKGLGDYDLGRIVGLYASEGYCSRESETIFCLHSEENELIDFIIGFAKERFGALSHIYYDKKWNACTVSVKSKGFTALMKEYVGGKTAPEKHLYSRVFNMDLSFRMGFIQGMFDGDGYSRDNDCAIHLSSKELVKDIASLLVSVGAHYSVRTNKNNTTKEGHKYTSYVVNILKDTRHLVLRGVGGTDYPNKCLFGKAKRDKTNRAYLEVIEVERRKRNPNQKYVYDFIVDSDSQLFSLPNGIITHNCRLNLKLDERDLERSKRPEELRFTALQNTTINLPRLSYKADHDDKKLFDLIKEHIELVVKSHLQKKKFIKRLLDLGDAGPLNFFVRSEDGEPYLRIDETTFLVGIFGLNEMVQHHKGYQLHESKEAFEFGLDVIGRMAGEVLVASDKYKIKLALEETPAESSGYRLATLDLQQFPEQAKKVVKGDTSNGHYYYTNSVHLATDAPVDFIERIEKQSQFHQFIKAGAICHVWLGEHEPCSASLENAVMKIYKNTDCTQVAFSPEFTVCEDCGKTSRGLHDTCYFCESHRVYGLTRITGYFSKVQSWNDGKVAELSDRVREGLA